MISLLVLLVPVMLLVGGYQLLAGRTQPVAIDPAVARSAAEAAGLTVLMPAELADDWVPISAVFREAEPEGAVEPGGPGAETAPDSTDDPDPSGGTLRVGYVTPDGGSVQVVQSTVGADELLAAELPAAATPAGTVELAGRPWQVYSGAEGERALVWLAPSQTVLVVGAASEQELRELAGSLR